MKLSEPDVNHLRRLLGYMRCEVGQSPQELVSTVQSILPATGEPSSDGKQRLLEAHTKAQNIPKYVRAAIKALEKVLASEHDIVDGELTPSPLPVCFLCGLALAEHRKNKQGHPWRRGSVVTKVDLQQADAVTIQRHYRPALQYGGDQ